MNDGDQQPMGTIGMVASMFGLGPLFEAAQSPDFHQYAQSIIASIIATNQRCERIERQLEKVCRVLGVSDDQPIAEYLPVRPAVPEQHGANGVGRTTAANSTADDGSGRASPFDQFAAGSFALPSDLGELLAQAAGGHPFNALNGTRGDG